MPNLTWIDRAAPKRRNYSQMDSPSHRTPTERMDHSVIGKMMRHFCPDFPPMPTCRRTDGPWFGEGELRSSPTWRETVPIFQLSSAVARHRVRRRACLAIPWQMEYLANMSACPCQLHERQGSMYQMPNPLNTVTNWRLGSLAFKPSLRGKIRATSFRGSTQSAVSTGTPLANGRRESAGGVKPTMASSGKCWAIAHDRRIASSW
jgi:hypothetical protein